MTAIALNKDLHRLPRLRAFILKMDGGLVVLLALPWLIFLANPNWIFSPTGSIDPWVYFGCFLNFEQYVEVYAGTYYVTRLPWILPGYVCYKIFPPLVANYVLHAGFYCVAVISLYFTLKQTVGSRPALIASILMGSYPFFLGAIGWDYVDGAGIVYFLLAMLLLTLAAKNSYRSARTVSEQRSESTMVLVPKASARTAVLLCLAGAAVAALIYTNTFLANFVPVMTLYYIIVNHHYRKNSLAASLLFALLGFAALTVLLGIVNMAAGGKFLFFWPSFAFAWYMSGHPNPWRTPGYVWVANATSLIYPSLVFLASLSSLLLGRLKRATQPDSLLSRPVGTFTLCYALIFLIMVLWELKGNPVLQLTSYTSLLIPGMFLALGSQIAHLLIGASKRQFFWLVVGLVIFVVVPFYAPFHSLLAPMNNIFYPAMIIVLGILIMVLSHLRTKSINVKSMALLFLFLAVVNFTFVGSGDLVDRQARKQGFLAIEKSMAAYRPFNLSGDLRFWYSNDETQGTLYRSVASTDFWGYRLINESFPVLEVPNVTASVKETASITQGIKIVILSSEPDAFKKAKASFDQVGQRAELLGEEKVEQGTIKFTMTFIEIKDNK